MRTVLSAKEMASVDRLSTERYGIPSILLMENAASAVADAVERIIDGPIKGSSVLVLCGRGNNGGDGAAAARLLWTRGARVRVFLFGSIKDTKGDAETNFRIARDLAGSAGTESGCLEFAEMSEPGGWADVLAAELKDADVIVDALFGTGLSRPLEGELASVVGLIGNGPSTRPPVISIDVPSGLDADSPEPIGPHVTADLTVTFTAPKLASVMPPSSRSSGDLTIAEIGTPSDLVEEAGSMTFLSEDRDAAEWLNRTAFSEDSYKKKRGSLLLIAGSAKYSGAAVLAANAAIESGVGLVTVATPHSAFVPVAERCAPEVIAVGVEETPGGVLGTESFGSIAEMLSRADAVGIGCGLGSYEGQTRELVTRLVSERKVPFVVDADGLNSISPLGIRGADDCPLILTPHQGEFLRLLGADDDDPLQDRVSAVREFASANHVILVLKGERTVVGEPGGRVALISTGNSGLGKAGNGDNLTGLLAGFVAQAVRFKVGMFETVVASLHLGGLAGDLARREFGRRTMIASDVRRSLAEAIRHVSGTEDA